MADKTLSLDIDVSGAKSALAQVAIEAKKTGVSLLQVANEAKKAAKAGGMGHVLGESGQNPATANRESSKKINEIKSVQNSMVAIQRTTTQLVSAQRNFNKELSQTLNYARQIQAALGGGGFGGGGFGGGGSGGGGGGRGGRLLGPGNMPMVQQGGGRKGWQWAQNAENVIDVEAWPSGKSAGGGGGWRNPNGYAPGWSLYPQRSGGSGGAGGPPGGGPSPSSWSDRFAMGRAVADSAASFAHVSTKFDMIPAQQLMRHRFATSKQGLDAFMSGDLNMLNVLSGRSNREELGGFEKVFSNQKLTVGGERKELESVTPFAIKDGATVLGKGLGTAAATALMVGSGGTAGIAGGAATAAGAGVIGNAVRVGAASKVGGGVSDTLLDSVRFGYGGPEVNRSEASASLNETMASLRPDLMAARQNLQASAGYRVAAGKMLGGGRMSHHLQGLGVGFGLSRAEGAGAAMELQSQFGLSDIGGKNGLFRNTLAMESAGFGRGFSGQYLGEMGQNIGGPLEGRSGRAKKDLEEAMYRANVRAKVNDPRIIQEAMAGALSATYGKGGRIDGGAALTEFFLGGTKGQQDIRGVRENISGINQASEFLSTNDFYKAQRLSLAGQNLSKYGLSSDVANMETLERASISDLAAAMGGDLTQGMKSLVGGDIGLGKKLARDQLGGSLRTPLSLAMGASTALAPDLDKLRQMGPIDYLKSVSGDDAKMSKLAEASQYRLGFGNSADALGALRALAGVDELGGKTGRKSIDGARNSDGAAEAMVQIEAFAQPALLALEKQLFGKHFWTDMQKTLDEFLAKAKGEAPKMLKDAAPASAAGMAETNIAAAEITEWKKQHPNQNITPEVIKNIKMTAALRAEGIRNSRRIGSMDGQKDQAPPGFVEW